MIAREVRQRINRQIADAQTFIAGADLGNCTSLYKTGNIVVQLPSYVGIGNLDDLLSTRLGSGSAGGLKAGEYAVECGGATFFVGDLAIVQATGATTQRGDSNRYANGHTLILLMALVGVAHPALTSVRLRLVTGLPIKTFRDRPALKADVRHTLEGVHFFTFHDANGSRSMCLEVEAVGVVMEGLGAARAFGATGKPMVVVDIGGDSFDVAFIDAHGEVIDIRSGSLMHNGSERIGELLSSGFHRQFGRDLTPPEVEATLRNYLSGWDTTIYEAGECSIEVSAVQRAIDTVTAAGNSFLSQKLGPRPGSDAAEALVIGGAARYIKPALSCPVTIPAAPERTNVEAYVVFAQRAEANNAWPKKA